MDKKIIISFFTLLLFFLFGEVSFAKDIYNDNSTDLKNYTVLIPQGLEVNAVLSDQLNSNNAIVGQIVKVYLLEDFNYGSLTIAKAGSTVSGTVVKNKKAAEEPAMTLVRFTSIRTPYNNVIPISAIIKTSDKSGVLRGTKELRDVIIQADTKLDLFFDQPITLVAQ